MSYADQRMSGSKVVAIVIVALIHAVIGYAFVTGLAYQYVKKAAEKLNTFDVEEPPPATGRTATPTARHAPDAAAGRIAAADRQRAAPTRGDADGDHTAAGCANGADCCTSGTAATGTCATAYRRSSDAAR